MKNYEKYIIVCFCAALLILLCACAKSKPKDVVYIPTRAEIKTPTLAPKSENTLENIKNIFIFANEMECALDFATSGEICASEL